MTSECPACQCVVRLRPGETPAIRCSCCGYEGGQ